MTETLLTPWRLKLKQTVQKNKRILSGTGCLPFMEIKKTGSFDITLTRNIWIDMKSIQSVKMVKLRVGRQKIYPQFLSTDTSWMSEPSKPEHMYVTHSIFSLLLFEVVLMDYKNKKTPFTSAIIWTITFCLSPVTQIAET